MRTRLVSNRKKAMLALAVIVFLTLVITGVIRGLKPDTVTVVYNNDGIKMPVVIGNVQELRVYMVKSKLYQVVVYIRQQKKPVVFTQDELFSWKSAFRHRYNISVFQEQTYHTYDPYLQGMKLELNKEYLHEIYDLYLGREPTQGEINSGLNMLSQKVQKADFEWRLGNSPEAILYTLRGQGTTVGEDAVRGMLAQGIKREEIIRRLNAG